MFKLLFVTSCLHFTLGGNLIEVLQDQQLTTLIALVQKAGLTSALLGGRNL